MPVALQMPVAMKPPAPLEVDVLTSLEALRSLRADWKELEAAVPADEAPFFQTFDWIEHVVRVRSARPGGFEPRIAVIRRGNEVVGIWPLAIQAGFGVRLLRSLDDPFGQFGGALFRSPDDAAPGIAAAISALSVHADAFRIEQVAVGSRLHEALRQAEVPVVAAQDAVVIDLRPYADFEVLYRLQSAKFRKILRNLRNRLERDAPLVHVVADDPETLATVIRHAFEGRVAWMKEHGRTSDAFRAGDFTPLMESLPASGVRVLGFLLMSGETPVAAQFGFEHGGRYYAYMSWTNPAFLEFSAGRIHLGIVIEACMARGIKVMELMPPATRYKLEWQGGIKPLQSLALPLTLRGRLAFLLLDRVLPLLRQASRRIPEPIRRSLVNLLNRN